MAAATGFSLEGIEKKIEANMIVGYRGATIEIHSSILYS